MSADPHGGARIERFGAPVSRARHTVIALHGRGASAADMRGLADRIGIPDAAWLAPTAGGNSWWPVSFLAPHARLQPFLDSALAAVDRCIDLAVGDGAERGALVVLGFSQGACLALEHAARSPGAAGSVFGLSGGLLGTGDDPAGAPTDALHGHAPKVFDYPPHRRGPSVYIGCHERDPHIPLARVRRSGAVFEALGASVTLETFAGAGHGVVAGEIGRIRRYLNDAPRPVWSTPVVPGDDA